MLVLMVEVELVLMIPDTFTLTIMKQELMLNVEVDMGLIPGTLSCASMKVVLYCWVFHFLLLL